MDALAYHAVVHALECAAGTTKTRKFAEAIRHALSGHLPYHRYVDAGRKRERARTGADLLEAMIRDQLALDLNPLSQATRLAPRLDHLLTGYNAYNQRVNLGAKTSFRGSLNQGEVETKSILRSRQQESVPEPMPCQFAAVYAFQHLTVEANSIVRDRAPEPVRRMSDVASTLGLDAHVIGDVCRGIEALGQVPISSLARELGISQRTLERSLRDHDLTAEKMRLVDRLLVSLEGIGSDIPLADIAAGAGFSDQAQMTRSFRASCGMTPGFFRKALLGNPISNSG